MLLFLLMIDTCIIIWEIFTYCIRYMVNGEDCEVLVNKPV